MDGAGKSVKELISIGFLEALGTAILLIAINFSFGNPLVLVFGIFTAAILSGRLTGAHFNTAVTIAVMLADDYKKIRKNLPLIITLMISQIIGGYIGQLCSWIELGEDIAALSPKHPDLFPPWKVFLIELFFTFIMMVSITHNIFPHLSIQSDTVLAVGSVCVSVYFSIKCTADATGACLNPVVAIVNVTFVAIVRKGTGVRDFMEYLPVYFFGPLLAGILAGLFCKYIVSPWVPGHYHQMISTFRDEVKNRYSTVPLSNKFAVDEDVTKASNVEIERKQIDIVKQ